MKNLIAIAALITMGATLAVAHPYFYPPGPLMGFQVVASSPQVGVYLYWGAPIFIGPSCPPDGWGYYGPVSHRYWGWYHGGYFYCWNHNGWRDWEQWSDRWRHDGYEHRWDGDEQRKFDRRDIRPVGDQGRHNGWDNSSHSHHGNKGEHGRNGHHKDRR